MPRVIFKQIEKLINAGGSSISNITINDITKIAKAISLIGLLICPPG